MRDFARHAARAWLRMLVRLLPQASRPWGEGMLAELDYVDDYAVAGWASGASTALVRHAVAHAHAGRAVRAAFVAHRTRLVVLVLAMALMGAILVRKHGRSVSMSRPVSTAISP